MRNDFAAWGDAIGLLLVAVLGLAVWVPTPGASAGGLEPPESFARPAAAAQAAAIMLERPEDEGAEPDPIETPTGWPDRSIAAGIIVDPNGFALTSARAVLRSPDFKVVLGDRTVVDATVVAVDRKTDVAVLKLRDGSGIFPYLPFGDSGRIAVGDWVIAVGAPRGFAATVTAGVITATPMAAGPHPLHGLVQTDALRGPGKPGAAVVNLAGEIVGLGSGLGGDAGYARPSNLVRKVYDELLEKGRVSRSWLGVTTQTLEGDVARVLGVPDNRGVLVSDALPGGPAAAAGMRGRDIIVAIDGTPVASRLQLDHAVNALSPGHVARLALRRDGRALTARVTIAEEPLDWRQRPGLVTARRLFGIEVEPLTPTMGAVVVNVDPASTAASAGIQPGDLVREVNRMPIRTIGDFQSAVSGVRARASVLMLIQRGDMALYVAVPADE